MFPPVVLGCSDRKLLFPGSATRRHSVSYPLEGEHWSQEPQATEAHLLSAQVYVPDYARTIQSITFVTSPIVIYAYLAVEQKQRVNTVGDGFQGRVQRSLGPTLNISRDI